MNFYKFPNYAIGKIRKQMSNKPSNVREETKRAWRLCRINKKLPFRLSTIELSLTFNCSETLICHLIHINEKRDKLPSNKVIRRKIILEKPFDSEVPF